MITCNFFDGFKPLFTSNQKRNINNKYLTKQHIFYIRIEYSKPKNSVPLTINVKLVY